MVLPIMSLVSRRVLEGFHNSLTMLHLVTAQIHILIRFLKSCFIQQSYESTNYNHIFQFVLHQFQKRCTVQKQKDFTASVQY